MSLNDQLDQILRIGADENVSARVKALRTERGWSLEELSERLAQPAINHPLNRSSLWKIESGDTRRRVSLREALAFAKVFGVSVDSLYMTAGQIAQREIADAALDAARLLAEAHQAWSRYADAVDGARTILGRVSDEAEARLELGDLRDGLQTKHEREALKLWKHFMVQRIGDGESVDVDLMRANDATILASDDFARFARAVNYQPTYPAVDDILGDVVLTRDALLPGKSRSVRAHDGRP